MSNAEAKPNSHFPTSPANMHFAQYLTCKDMNLSCQFFYHARFPTTISIPHPAT